MERGKIPHVTRFLSGTHVNRIRKRFQEIHISFIKFGTVHQTGIAKNLFSFRNQTGDLGLPLRETNIEHFDLLLQNRKSVTQKGVCDFVNILQGQRFDFEMRRQAIFY